MPINDYGQMVTFAVDRGGDYRFEATTKFRVTKANRTCKKIAAFRGHPKLARRIADMNNIRNPRSKLKVGRQLRVPGILRGEASFSVLAGDTAPIVMSGYSKVSVVDRSERAGLSVFTGFDPVVLQVPVRFESMDNALTFVDKDGAKVESDIAELERMAGRGIFEGAAVGAPPLVAVSTTNAKGDPVQLIPFAFQSSLPKKINPNAPVYWVSGIDWDNDPVRNVKGDRIRQLATIELTEYVRPKVAMGAAERHKAQNKKTPPKGGKPKTGSKAGKHG